MNRKQPHFLSAILLLSCIIILQCDREEMSPREFPMLKMIDQVTQTDDGITFTGEITKQGSFDIVEKGFAWSLYGDPTIYSPHVAVNEPATTRVFQLKTTFDYQKNNKYFVRAYVRDSKYTVYSNTVEFETTHDCSPPIITGFWPEKAKINDTIRISGKNLSYLTYSFIVNFGEAFGYNIASTDTTILVRVPENKNYDPIDIKVTINNNNVTSSKKFSYIQPEILDFYPKEGTFLDTVTIIGSNLPVGATNQVKIDGLPTSVVYQSSTAYKFIVPKEVNKSYAYIFISVAGVTKSFTEPFMLSFPLITNVSPTTLNSNAVRVTITGNNFNPDKTLNTVQFGNYTAEVISSTKNEIIAKFPYNLKTGIYKLKLTVGGMSVISGNNFSYTNPWAQKAPLSASGRYSAAAFVINNKGYVGTGYNGGSLKDFWEYDPLSNFWTKKADFEGQARYNAFGFSTNSKGYIGSGSYGSYSSLLDFWEYNPSSNSWTKRTNYPGYSTEYSPAAFPGADMGYVCFGTNLYAYSEATNSWTKKSDNPIGRVETAFFRIDHKIYVCLGWNAYQQPRDDLWEYDTGTNTWTKKASFPGGSRMKAVGFALNGKGYVGLGQKSDNSMPTDFWEYDPQTDTWDRIPDFAGSPRRQPVSFVINGKAYIATGYFNSNYLNDLWEFDPSR